MKTILIVFHSLTGGTRQMAHAAREAAAREADIDARLLHAAQTTPAESFTS